MIPKLSQDYTVDERYKGLRGHRHTVDNDKGLNFLRGYIGGLRDQNFPRPLLIKYYIPNIREHIYKRFCLIESIFQSR